MGGEAYFLGNGFLLRIQAKRWAYDELRCLTFKLEAKMPQKMLSKFFFFFSIFIIVAFNYLYIRNLTLINGINSNMTNSAFKCKCKLSS